MMKENRPGIYIHIPFCMSRCPYCDFYSVIPKEKSLKEHFLDALTAEISDFAEKRPEFSPDTIYFGGGTPSLLENEDISRILQCIFTGFHIENPENIEITMEFNPKSMEKYDEMRLSELKNMGVNRISVGSQSFNEGTLRKLGRIHKVEDTYSTFSSLRSAGFKNISLDIMFGIPGETFEEFSESLRHAIELSPEHFSLYSLEFMEGTRFTRLLSEGKMKETDPETDRLMYHTAIDMLKEAGYMQYEISNFSKKGFESRHNLKYWNMSEYIGFGPSAHSYTDGKRFSNVSDIHEYIENPLKKEVYEECTFEDTVSEYTFTSLRKNEGIDLIEFRERFGTEFWDYYKDVKEEFLSFEGYVYCDDNTVRLNELGFDISNEILCLFV